MKNLPLSDFSDLLLRLYRLSHELPIELFQDAALELVKRGLPFDSSMWGTATNTDAGIDIHTIHLHNQPEEMLGAYEQVKHLDTAAVLVQNLPGGTLASNTDVWFSRKDQGPLRDYARRFEQQNFFVSTHLHPQTHFLHWISLYRADPEAHCSEDERRLLVQLWPHVRQALSLNRVVHLDRVGSAGATHRGSAIGDLRGVLYHADEGFERCMRSEFSDWQTRALPSVVLDHFLAGNRRFVGHSIVATQRVEHRLLFLAVRARCRADNLTSRERAIAELAAKGHTHKEVARRLECAPATVRNHLQAVYGKLEIGNIAGLIRELQLAG